MAIELIKLTDRGLYCEPGDFYIDPWKSVRSAVITHAHSDHARIGSDKYLTAESGKYILRSRLGEDAKIECLPYGEAVEINGVRLSFHPAGHVLGSAQVRLEYNGEIWVASGDYKLEKDATCAPFEPLPCHTFITESTFGLPIYRWLPECQIFSQINDWWQKNKENGKASLLYGYALGKSQRLLSGLEPSIGPIFAHGAVQNINDQYRQSGVKLPETKYVGEMPKGTDFAGSIILAPPSAHGSPWTRQFGSTSTAFASGWMRIRGTRRRKSVDRGFALSDHADWNGLNQAIKATGAERIIVTHGYANELVRWLRENGLQASTMRTEYEGELEEVTSAPSSEEAD
ncbi:MAG TPA: ligase-associated DNA damage response exonuclease [Oculatellaceae cyanobacterium]